jgi:hypothetical protein
MAGRKPTRFNDGSRVYTIRLSAEAYEWVRSMGDMGPDIVRSLIDDYRMSKDDRFLDRALAEAKDQLMTLETEVLNVKRRIKDLESVKAKLVESQLDHLRVRQKLLEKYMQDPHHFMGWLTGPANMELVSEGKFGSPQEVAEFCRKEMERYRRGSR